MRKNPWLMLVVLLVVFGGIIAFLIGSAGIALFGRDHIPVMSKNSILHLKLDGVIMDASKFLKPLIKYREDKSIKAILVEVSSPGGIVGPSQEIYYELKRTREVFKKPVIVVSTSLNASGAYYASVAADKIFVVPGTMIGSIGVIMEFTNLEKLYDWAKITRFSINTGKFKDSGAEYRPMRDDERALFQDMMNSVWEQFKAAVADGRNLKPDVVNEYADGRVLTGEQAVKLGFADDFATLEEGFEKTAEFVGLKKGDWDVFEAPKERRSLLDYLREESDDDPYSSVSQFSEATAAIGLVKQIVRPELQNKLLFLMPGTY